MNWNILAPKVGFSTVTEGADLQPDFSDFSVWDWGTGRYSRILGGMDCSLDAGKIVVADYEYEYSKNLRAPADVGGMRRGLTFCILRHEALALPQVHLRNESPAHQLFKRAVGSNDIYFPEDTEFSDHFEIQGDEDAVRDLFKPEIRSYFLRYFKYTPLRMELNGDALLLHFGMMIRPEDSHMLLYNAVDIGNFWMDKALNFEVPSELLFKDEK